MAMDIDPPGEVIAAVSAVLDVATTEHHRAGAVEGWAFWGTLKVPSAEAFTRIRPHLESKGYTPLLRQRKVQEGVVVVPTPQTRQGSRRRLALILLLLTALSTTFVGILQARDFSLGLGLLHSIPLLLILGAHEAGHYLAARRFGMNVSAPMFFPFPLPPLGTLGAAIAMREPPPSRSALLLIAIAGPLAGLSVALPLLFVGLMLSDVRPIPVGQPIVQEGASLLYSAIKTVVFGRVLPAGGEDVMLHPVAFSAWAGLLITAFNLLPAGQLDGGHVLTVLVGPRIAWAVSATIAGGFIAMAFFFWQGWLTWAIVVGLMLRRRVAPLDDITPLRRGERVVAVAMLVLFVLLFTPIPLQLVTH